MRPHVGRVTILLKTIRQKVIAASAAVLLLCLGIGGAGLWVQVNLADALKRSGDAADLIRSHMNGDMMHDALRADVLSALLSHNPATGIEIEDVKKDVQEHQNAFRESIKKASSLANDPASRAALAELDKPLAAYVAGVDKIIGLSGRDLQAAESGFADFLGKFKALETAMKQASDKISAAADADSESAVQEAAFGRSLMLVSIGAGLLFGLLLLVVAFRAVLAPIKQLATDMNELAGGNLDLELKGAARQDEIGAIGRGVRAFQEVIVAKSKAEAEEVELRRRAAAEADRREQAERQARAEEQAAVVGDLANGLAQLATGNLTGRLSSFPQDYRQLEDDFNAAITKLQETISVIAGNTEGIRSGTGEISQAADNLSKRTEQQAASLEETAAALDEITATVRKTADGANHARQVVSTAKSDAERSGEIVGNAVAAMSEIEKSSAQISQIIGVIDEIAFQTNLLALNAGVEAARAGDAGKGFAVVASEVRALAQRSAEAAKEIKALISASTSQVASGVQLVGETGKALDRIAQQVTEINAIVAEIAASAQEQSTALAEVNTAVNQMDQMTQQNAAMVEESTAASHSLAQEAEKLTSLVGQFKTGQDAVSTAPALRPAPASKPRAAGPRPAARPMARGNTALAMRAEPDEDSWEEF
jgi:methyl-accepting chemotaxis protein